MWPSAPLSKGLRPALAGRVDGSFRVVYARPDEGAISLCEYDSGTKDVTVVYTARKSWYLPSPSIPDDVGYLPSPDGKRLLIWEGRWDYASHPVTHWVLADLREGTDSYIGLTEEPPWLLPHWLDSDRLMLRGDKRSVIYDARTGRLNGTVPRSNRSSLPSLTQARIDRARTRLLHYARRYCQAPEREVRSVVPRMTKRDPTLAEFFRRADEPLAYSLLRAAGIPGLLELSHPLKDCAPSVTPSPDRSLVAVAYASLRGCTDDRTGEPDSEKALTYLSIVRADSLREVKRYTLCSDRFVPITTEGPIIVDPARPTWPLPAFVDIRWSQDGRYLSFTVRDGAAPPRVTVVDAVTWRTVLEIPNAMNGFVRLSSQESKD